MHLQLARLADAPELAISESDGKAFLTAVQNVMRHYPVTASQKTIDWAALVFAASFIYLPRAAAMKARKSRPPPPPEPPSFHFHQPAPNGHAAPQTPPGGPPGGRMYEVEPELAA
jgi:hypothetical protein